MEQHRIHPPVPHRLAGRTLLAAALSFAVPGLAARAADSVPTDIQMPGTQPNEMGSVTIGQSGNCGCHNFNSSPPDSPEADAVPVFGWAGGMMANAGRDPLFWATVAIAEQDFLPEEIWTALGAPGQEGGVGDLCLKCHTPKGWLEGRSTPTNGSGMLESTDAEGVACELCHFMVNPDRDATVPGQTGRNAEYGEAQSAPFLAYDESTGVGYNGGAEYVLNPFGDRLGPFVAQAKHPWIENPFHHDAKFCGTCHDVSNPAVGDLAPNHGAMAPFTGPFSGVPNGPVADKAALNNPPHTYGIVERTYSEWLASGLDDLPVNDFPTLPADLRVAGGALDRAYRASLHGTCSGSGDPCNIDANCPGGETCLTTTADFADGATRYFTCQTCHMAATGGKAAQNGPFRPDEPRHDQTGGISYWIKDAIIHQDNAGTLRFGTGLTAAQIDAMNAGGLRGEAHLRSAASLSAVQVGNDLRVRVTNLTGHKLISGYPEGRRMWLQIGWYDAGGNLVGTNGEYGPLVNDLGDPVLAPDRTDTLFQVESILDPSSTRVYAAKPAITRDWAAALVGLGYPSDMVIEWDRLTHTAKHDLGELASGALGDMHYTFHFVLNNAMYRDNRIPPYRLDYDLVFARNAAPVPRDQYGGTAGGTYDHWDEVDFPIPAGAVRAEVWLNYQSTSWEYIQFLWKQNHRDDDNPATAPDPFLGNEGINLLDAWIHTGMAAPFRMAEITAASLTPPAASPPGSASGPAQPRMTVSGYDPSSGAIQLSYDPACDATGHTIHYGPIDAIGTYGWAAADCSFDASGSATFVPDPAVGESIFWVIAGHNSEWEGSYGTDGHGLERPQNPAAGACLRPRSWVNYCE